MFKHQIKGHVIVPVFLTFIGIQSIVCWINVIRGETLPILIAITYTFVFILLTYWFHKEEVYNLLLGFDHPKIPITLTYYLVGILGLTCLYNWWNPDFYKNIPSSLLLSMTGLGFISFYMLKEKLNTSHTFVRLAPNTYVDLVFNKVHTREDIVNKYKGERILIEDLHVDNLLLFSKYLVREKMNNNNNISIEILDTNYIKIIVSCGENIVWEEIYRYTEGNLDENKVRVAVMRLCSNL